MRNLAAGLLAAGLLAFAPGETRAAFALAQNAAKGAGASSFVVEWSDAVRPFGDKVSPAMMAIGSDPEQFDPDQPVVEPDPESLRLNAERTLTGLNGATSCLIAIPGYDNTTAADWRATATVLEGDLGAGKESPVELRVVRVGAIAALQVIVDRAAFAPDPKRGDGGVAALSIAIEPTGKALDAPKGAGALATMEGCEFLAANFLNGDALLASKAFRLAEPAKGAALPEPPGDWRIPYLSTNPVVGADTTSGTPLDPEILKFDLSAIGSNAGQFGDLRLVYDGVEVPVLSGSGDTVYFFAPRTHTAYDTHNAVFATIDAANPSPAFPTRPAFSSLTPLGVEQSIPRSKHVERNTRYERDSLNPAGQRLVHWQVSYTGTQFQTYVATLNDKMTTTTMSMEMRLHGLNSILEADPDHYADVFVWSGDIATSTTLPRRIWEGRTEEVLSETFDLAAVPAPPSAISIRHSVASNSPVTLPIPAGLGLRDIQNLESFELRWTGKPRIGSADGICRVEVAANGGTPTRVTVGGLPSTANANDVFVMDVTDPTAPVIVDSPSLFADESGGKAVEFEDAGNGAVYQVQRVSLVKSTATPVAAEELPALPPSGTPLSAVFVRPASFAATLAPLVALRGAGVVELNPQAAYNAYSGGRISPDAIKQAVADMVASAPERVAVPTLLIAGHGTFDSRNYLNAQVGPKVPAYEFLGTVQYFGSTREFPSDIPYAQIEGADEFPDLMLGRIAARTTAQLQNAVNRFVAYEPVAPVLATQQRVGFFPTDNTPTGDPGFGLDAPLWDAYWAYTGMPSYLYDFVSEPESGVVIEDTLENGHDGTPSTALCLYVGHGNFSRWASTSTMTTTMVLNNIVTQDKWPFVVALTCQNGIYAVPPTLETQISMADAWMFATPDKGAIGSLATTTEQSYLAMRPIVEEVMKGFGPFHGRKAETCGELYTFATTSFLTLYPALSYNSYGYHLFGDPMAPLGIDLSFNLAVPDWRALEE